MGFLTLFIAEPKKKPKMKFFTVFMLFIGAVLAMPKDHADTSVDVADVDPDHHMHRWVHGGHITHHHGHFTHITHVTHTITRTHTVHSKYHTLLHKCQTRSYNARRRCTHMTHQITHKIHHIQHTIHTILHHIRYYRYRYSVCHHACFKSCAQILNWYAGHLYHKKRRGDAKN